MCHRELDLWLAGSKTETADTSGDLANSTAVNQPPIAQAEASDQPIDRAADQSKAADDAKQDSGKTNSRRRGGRKKGSGSYDKLGAPLLNEMHVLIENDKAVSINEAAGQVASKAKGASTFESKVTRLSKKYKKQFGSN